MNDRVNELSDLNGRTGWPFFFEGQLPHLLLTLLLVPGVLCLADSSLTGQMYGGLTDRQWTVMLVAVVTLHQWMVWLIWRLQICFGGLSRLLGQADLVVWALLFFPFLAARIVLLGIVGLSNGGSLGLPLTLALVAGGLMALPALFTLWSVHRYFGWIRALGGDHFRARYWQLPLVKEGIFRYSPNAMYTFGFLMTWAIALWLDSRVALLMALFQHAYIWVHYYCTEKPDLDVLYGG
ncbi:MAG: methyltransferase [Cyanophyceae cyanobacterium]